MSRIFISYSSKDHDFILKFAQDLKNAGHDVWLDKWNIVGREPYWKEIQDGIESCSHFLFAISPDSIDDDGGAYLELSHATGLPPTRRPVILVMMVRPTPYTDLPILISPGKYQIHDFTQRRYADTLRSLLRALQPAEATLTTAPPLPLRRTIPAQPASRAIPINRASLIMIVGAIVVLIALGAIFARNPSNPTPTPSIGATNTPQQIAQGIIATTQVPTVPINTAPSTPAATPTDEPNFKTLAAATFTQEALRTINVIASYIKTSTPTLTPLSTTTPTPSWTPLFTATPTLNRQLTLNAVVAATKTANAIASIVPATLTPPTLAPIKTRKDSKGIEQVWVPAGCFMMGSDPAKDKNAQPDEQPQHHVCLTNRYWIDKYEVTNAAYQKFMDDGGYTKQTYWSVDGWKWLQSQQDKRPTDYDGFTDAQQPRVGVSWYEAEAYAKWRSGRLPTEAEWEYAARGPQSPIYPWGDQYENSRANVDETTLGGKYLKRTALVGSYLNVVSWTGAYDIAGNVWEWTADWYNENYYKQNVIVDPPGTTSGSGRAARGGSWRGFPESVRAAIRARFNPTYRYVDQGFRLVTSDSN